MFDAVDVRIARCLRRELKRPGVVCSLCSVDVGLQRREKRVKPSVQNALKKRQPILLSVLLYINCNVRSCQYSAFVGQCVSPVRFHQRDAKVGCFQFFFSFSYWNIHFIRHSQCHFNFGAKRPRTNHYIILRSLSLYSVMRSSCCCRGGFKRGIGGKNKMCFHVVLHCVGIAALSSFPCFLTFFFLLKSCIYRSMDSPSHSSSLSVVWCSTLVLNNHNHQPKQPQAKTAPTTAEVI